VTRAQAKARGWRVFRSNGYWCGIPATGATLIRDTLAELCAAIEQATA
jgi:hypothetical protein